MTYDDVKALAGEAESNIAIMLCRGPCCAGRVHAHRDEINAIVHNAIVEALQAAGVDLKAREGLDAIRCPCGYDADHPEWCGWYMTNPPKCPKCGATVTAPDPAAA